MKSCEYWKEVEAVAAQAVELAIEIQGSNADLGDVYDQIYTLVDGHEYIIYTAESLHVLLHTSNDNEYFSIGGILQTESASDTYQLLAFYAMQADVGEHVSDLLEEALEATKAAEEEEGEDDDS